MEIELVEVLRLIIYFFIYSVFGWVLESVYKTISEKKFVNSGFLYGPICPIYGTGAILMILFLSSFKNNIFLLFLVGFVVLSIWEYFVGWLLEALFNTKYWDYTQNKFNIKGRVCLANSVIWGILGVVFIGFLHPILNAQIIKVPQVILLYTNIVLVFFIIIDIVISVIRVNSMNSALDKFKNIGEIIKEKLEELTNLREAKNITINPIKEIKQSTIEKIEGVKEGIEVKIESVKSEIEEKIKGVEDTINELKSKQNAINIKFYKKAERIKKAFPTMKSERMSMFIEQKRDEKKLKEQKISTKKPMKKQK